MTNTGVISPRLRLALRAVKSDRDEFEQAYRTMTAAEIGEMYGLTAYDIKLLREHWGLSLKAPAKGNGHEATTTLTLPATVDPDALADAIAERVWAKLESWLSGRTTK